MSPDACFIELVRTQTSDGIVLDGALCCSAPEREDQSDINAGTGPGIDLVIFHHGAARNFYTSGPLEYFARRLKERNIPTLCVNNRGHDFVSWVYNGKAVRRIGSAYECLDDCRYDFDAWLNFAQSRGFERIVLWGHSLGATKALYHANLIDDPRVAGILACSPPRFSYSTYAALPEGPEFLATVALAQSHVAEGRPEALIETSVPLPLLLTAEVFLDKYGDHDRYDYLPLLERIAKPTLIVVGEQESQSLTAFKGVPELLMDAAARHELVDFVLVSGSDHSYTKKEEEVWTIAVRWLQDKLGLAVPDILLGAGG